ncbi:MAG: DUF167 domain-containing protein [Pyrinomonadaceae bacterium]
MVNITESEGAISFTVNIVPRSSQTQIVAGHDCALKIKLKSPPVDGAANEELVRFLSKVCGVPRSNVEIVSGKTSRKKRIRISGAKTAEMITILQAKI